ncbi:hypothetical protein GQX73_g10093 [Xylaria multiplex]|uniref:Rhodopsin domain-containing protein n=1 Tax=Xylaria multiplex TaxID=323545 RepID=A0A7C8IJY9_9PEZI|nr:hypothetical protein GQX73_g10093 [Xylaria multiplex]
MSYYPPSTVIPIYSVFMGVAVALTALRLWVRLSFARIALGVDDYLLLFGLAVAITCNGIQYYNSLKGTGGEAIDPADMEEKVIISHQIDWAMIVIEKAGFGAIKLSILFFYRRIFGVWGSFRRVNNALLWIVLAWAVLFTLADVLICGAHPELIWGFDQTIALHRCGNRGALLLAFSVTSVATDLPVLGLPFFYISRLQMATSKKWATSFVFFIGALSTGASVLRLIFLIVSYPVGRLNFAYTAPPDNQTPLVLKIFNPTFWALAELWLGVWAANLPPCAPLLRSMNFNPYRRLSSAYRRIWTKESSTGSSSSRPAKTPFSDGTEDYSGSSSGKRGLTTQDSVPLVSMPRHSRGPSVTSENPPSLDPIEWSGTGRLSGFGLLSSVESGSQQR